MEDTEIEAIVDLCKRRLNPGGTTDKPFTVTWVTAGCKLNIRHHYGYNKMVKDYKHLKRLGLRPSATLSLDLDSVEFKEL